VFFQQIIHADMNEAAKNIIYKYLNQIVRYNILTSSISFIVDNLAQSAA
jgi:hypothetical protein